MIPYDQQSQYHPPTPTQYQYQELNSGNQLVYPQSPTLNLNRPKSAIIKSTSCFDLSGQQFGQSPPFHPVTKKKRPLSASNFSAGVQNNALRNSKSCTNINGILRQHSGGNLFGVSTDDYHVNTTSKQEDQQQPQPTLDANGEIMVCCNCKTTQTPLWRKDKENENLNMCNACGLYYKKHGEHRPMRLQINQFKSKKKEPTTPKLVGQPRTLNTSKPLAIKPVPLLTPPLLTPKMSSPTPTAIVSSSYLQ
eukprot:Pgem_evm1s9051